MPEASAHHLHNREVKKQLYVPEAIFSNGCHGNTVYQVSPPCVVCYAGLKSEVVIV